MTPQFKAIFEAPDCFRYARPEQLVKGQCPTTDKMCPSYKRGRCAKWKVAG